MGSFCTSSPSKTESTQSYTPAGLDQLKEIWGKVSSAASTPYQPYGGQMVADLNSVQKSGISNINNAAGSASPYFDLAAQYGKQGAAAINPNDVAQYTNPYTQKAIEATRANFGETNAQQQQQVVGNAAMKGALGGDRVGVAQSELARQQKLAQDPVIAGMYDKSYTDAMNVLAGNRTAAGQGAFTFGSLAPAIQNSQIQGGQAQIGAGSVAQGNEQQKLSADYQQYLQKLAFPYQQAQFLASAGLPAISAMGGTQQGTTINTPSQQSPFQQIAGLGLTAAGLMTGNPMMAMGSMGSMFGGGGGNPSSAAYGSNPFTPYGTVNPAYGVSGVNGYRRGGSVRGVRSRPRFADGGFVDRVHAIRQALRGGGPVIDMRRGNDGGYYADGGEVSFADRFGAANDAIEDGNFDPVGDNYVSPFPSIAETQPMAAAAPIAGNVPLPLPRPQTMAANASPFALRPQIPSPQSGVPISALAYDGHAAPTGGLRTPPPLQSTPAEAAPAPMAMPSQFMSPARLPSSQESSGPFGLSEDARMGLLSAGLGILASRNPSGLGAVGEGGLAGVKHYADAKKTRAANDLAASRLVQQAEQFAQGLDVRKGTLAEQKRYHDIVSSDRQETTAERKRAAQERSEDRRDTAARTAYPGEGLDDKGNTVKGLYQFNPDTREYDFKPGKMIQKGATGSGAKEGQTERLIKQLKEENPTLSTAEAIALTKRAPNGDQQTLRRESLALSAAKADIGYLRDPSATLEKWRKQYGLGAVAQDAPAGSRLNAPSQRVLEGARDAIKRGADRDAVMKRIRDAGYDPSGI